MRGKDYVTSLGVLHLPTQTMTINKADSAPEERPVSEPLTGVGLTYSAIHWNNQ